MEIMNTPIDGLTVAKTNIAADNRGAFGRFFCKRELSAVIGNRDVVQINFSRTMQRGAVRGMHFQYPPDAELKCVRCVRGRVFDIAVDLRHGSPTFLQWHAAELSPENADMFVIPEGFAHGFQALEENSELLYIHTAYYNKANEGGLRYDDVALAIDWPLPVTQISDRDLSHPFITSEFKGIHI